MKLVLQNSLTEMRDQGIGLENRWKGILQEISSSISFIPNDNELRRSTWVKGTKIGAIHITGMYKNNIPAVIKLQGIKPITSEVTMIELFNQHNKSKLIRSPKIYEHLPWDQEKQVEVILSEKVEGQWAVAHNPATNEDLERFFSIYEDYRQNCIHTPWVQKPTSFSYSKQLERWQNSIKEAQEQDIYKSIIDIGIAQKGVDILDKEFHLGNFKFMHGHFWYGDMIMPSKKEVVLFSNLLWSWRYPFYDITFSYHWHMLGMEHVENLTEDLMKKEREKWWNRYFNLANVKNNKSNQRLIKIALLERALAGILVDKFHLDFSKPQSEIVIRDRMKEVKKLIQSL